MAHWTCCISTIGKRHCVRSTTGPCIIRPVLSGPSVLTIHNLGYQVIPSGTVRRDGITQPPVFTGCARILWASERAEGWVGLRRSSTTVSPDLQSGNSDRRIRMWLGRGDHGRKAVLSGIVNGIDATLWNPRTDRYLPAPYTFRSLGRFVTNRCFNVSWGCQLKGRSWLWSRD